MSVQFVKVDVQGYEQHVLKGMKRLIESNSDIILLMELFPDGLREAESNSKLLCEELTRDDFDIRLITADGVQRVDSETLNNSSPGWYGNIVAARAWEKRGLDSKLLGN